jgi:hypothetical protein
MAGVADVTFVHIHTNQGGAPVCMKDIQQAI